MKYNNKYYDPSYGSSIANDANRWETPALDGFGSMVFFNDGSVQKFINWIGHINDNSPQSNIYP